MKIAQIIDHTNINPKATAKNIKETCQEAKKFGFRGVCIRPKWVKKEAIKAGTDIIGTSSGVEIMKGLS